MRQLSAGQRLQAQAGSPRGPSSLAGVASASATRVPMPARPKPWMPPDECYAGRVLHTGLTYHIQARQPALYCAKTIPRLLRCVPALCCT